MLLPLSHSRYTNAAQFLHAICSYFSALSPLPLLLSLSSPFQIMTERKNAKAMAGGSLQDRMQAGLDLPLQGRLHQFYVCLTQREREGEFCSCVKLHTFKLVVC